MKVEDGVAQDLESPEDFIDISWISIKKFYDSTPPILSKPLFPATPFSFEMPCSFSLGVTSEEH